MTARAAPVARISATLARDDVGCVHLLKMHADSVVTNKEFFLEASANPKKSVQELNRNSILLLILSNIACNRQAIVA